MNKIKKAIEDFDLSWKRLIIFAVLAAVYTAIMAILKITNNTSFKDITVTFEVWILFGIFIIMKSKSAKDSALKCFVFFLISQPLVYLFQVPFESFGIFGYYPKWFIWTLLTVPMGFLGYYMKEDKWWGLLILTPIMLLLGFHYKTFLTEVILYFPQHLLSAIFCIITLILYPLVIFKDKKIKIVGVLISIMIILGASFIALNADKSYYNTTILVSGGSSGAVFDNNYKAYLENEEYGNLTIEFNEQFNSYVVNAEFRKVGKTKVIIESPTGDKETYNIDIKRDSYEIDEK